MMRDKEIVLSGPKGSKSGSELFIHLICLRLKKALLKNAKPALIIGFLTEIHQNTHIQEQLLCNNIGHEK